MKQSQVAIIDLSRKVSIHFGAVDGNMHFKVGLWTAEKHREEEKICEEEQWQHTVCCTWVEPYSVDKRTKHFVTSLDVFWYMILY